MQLNLENDYNNGAHPLVLLHLVETNEETTLTYGFDRFSDMARQRIREACETPHAEIHFLAGGTQTNATVIDSMLQRYEGVVATESAHIAQHESGAIEASGHKVITLPSHDGKMHADELEQLLATFEADESRDHCVRPGMVYITFPTEYGTTYSARELIDLHDVCSRFGRPLFIDGARLGYGLCAEGSDINLPLLAHHCEAFYIGGTKVGALCGEAVVFPHNVPDEQYPRHIHPHFFSIVKQHGALMAKGRLIGVQFDALFTDDLYLRISHHAIDMAMRMRNMFRQAGFRFFVQSPTNQQFVILPNELMERLHQQVLFSIWAPFDANHTICRFVTSWATTEADLERLQTILGKISPTT